MEKTKTILVTGGSRGIGKEVALKYAENGYNVVINYVSDKTDVEAIKNELLEKGAHDVLLAKADVTNAEQIEELVKYAIEKFDAIDVLVNNNICSSRREAREFLNAGSITINDEKVKDENMLITKDIAIDNEIIVLKRGKKKNYICKIK